MLSFLVRNWRGRIRYRILGSREASAPREQNYNFAPLRFDFRETRHLSACHRDQKFSWSSPKAPCASLPVPPTFVE